MNTEEAALNLVDMCRKGQYMQAVDALYGKDIVSVEPHAMESMPQEMRGFEQVRGKTHWFLNNHEVHGSKLTGPFVAGDKFVVQFEIDVTDKASQKRMQMSEV